MFSRYLWKKKWHILLYLVLFTVATVMNTQLNLAVPELFDAAQVGKYQQVILWLGLLFVGVVVSRLLEYYADLSGVHFINLIRKDIKRDLFSAVIRKQLPDYADCNVGQYIAEFTNDITVIENKFLVPFKEIASYVITIVSVGVAVFTIDFRMALVIVAGFAVCLVLPIATTAYTSGRMMRFLLRFDKFVQYLKDLFGAFFTFKNYAVENNVIEKFHQENANVEKQKYNAEVCLALMNALIGRLAWSIEILVVVIGLLGVIGGSLSFGEVFAAYLLAGNLGAPLQSLGNRISMMRSVNGLEKKFKSLGMLETKTEAKSCPARTAEPFDIVLNNVGLQLRGNRVLENVSVTFEHGKKYLILGCNGSGKSTVAKLLKNNYRGYTGSVRIGDAELTTPEGVARTRCISYSNETVCLISDTVRNNILLYRDVPEAQLEKATALANLHIPMDRMAGDSGRFLSSGERRKLEIARALIEEPNVLILDEVVSTLDIETAYEIEKLVLSFEDRTVIMISNAFSGQLLEQYDRIILMDGGKVLATGKHRQLLEASSEYRRIYQLRCEEVEGEVCTC